MTAALRRHLGDLAGAANFDHAAAAAVATRAGQVLRPTGALAALDRLAVHLAGWQHSETPAVRRPAVAVFAADHGVAGAGVSAYPAAITTEMLAAVRAGKATVNAMARTVGAEVVICDVGVGDPSGDIRLEPAVSQERMDRIVETAVAVVDELHRRGVDLLVLGELGIGNTTPAAALAARFVGLPVDVAVGRGTGIDDATWATKCDVVARALERSHHLTDPLELLRHLGGAELIAIAAATARARWHGLPVLLDGYVVTASVLALAAVSTDAVTHLLAGHQSAEPGHRLALEHLGLRPILTLDLRLGEGTGALAALPLLEVACRAVTDVATFSEWSGDGAPASPPATAR